jgi:Tfp pilus assembly protein PilO
MGKIPTIAIIAIVVVLIIGISVAAFYFLIKPKQEELAGLKEKLAAEQAVVAQKTTTEAELAAVNAAWLKAQLELAALRERKSIPISMYMPLLAMTSMWYELREDLPKVVTNYLTSQGVTIQSGASMPAPQLAPPTVPASGFLQVPEGQSLTLAVSGTLANIKKVYSNLAQMPRIATIGALNLTGTGERLTATFPMTLYIIVEGAEAAAPPPAPAAAGPEGGPGGPGGAPAGAAGGEDGGGKKSDEKKGGDEAGGGGKKSKGEDGGGGDAGGE